MRYLSAVCFLAIVAFADARPAAALQNCACFCRVEGEGGGGCWGDVAGWNPRSGGRDCDVATRRTAAELLVDRRNGVRYSENPVVEFEPLSDPDRMVELVNRYHQAEVRVLRSK